MNVYTRLGMYIYIAISFMQIYGQDVSTSGVTLPAINTQVTYVPDDYIQTQQAQLIIPFNSNNKTNVAPKTEAGTRTIKTSFLARNYEPSGQTRTDSNGKQVPVYQTASTTHPTSLSTSAPNFNTNLATFLNSIAANPGFLSYFTNFHLIMLDQLYQYLTKIYTTFNLTHVNDITEHLQNEQTQALNKKTLIINHLISIIERQSNQAFLARMPALPKQLGTYAGKMLMQHDYGANLNLMLEQSEVTLMQYPDTDLSTTTKEAVQAHIKDLRSTYIPIFGQYLTLFSQYCATLQQDDPEKGYIGLTQFYTYAQQIQQSLAQYQPQLPTNFSAQSVQDKVNTIRSIKTLNPPLFFYDEDTFRGIKIIPALARSLPANTTPVGWPSLIVQEISQGTVLANKFGNPVSFGPNSTLSLSIGYFTDANGNQANASNAVHMFINIPIVNGLYTQELLKQPTWLNSEEGVLKMLRACLGDFSILLDPIFANENILDPCMTCIITNAANQNNPTACSDCVNLIQMMVNTIIDSSPTISPNNNGGGTSGPSGPDAGPSGPAVGGPA